MKFETGDKVRFLDEVGEGIVMGVYSDGKVKVLSMEGLDFVMAPNKLVLIEKRKWVEEKEDSGGHPAEEKTEVDPEDIIALKERMYKKPGESKPHKTLKTDTLEVDLHIEELLENTSGMSSGEKLVHQLGVFRETMEQALSEHRMRVIYIHGVGNGKLKSEIRRILREDYPSCEFFDANMGKYGFGATEVRIR